jgi:PadR family transcriptional regulator, regulatory protein AphA
MNTLSYGLLSFLTQSSFSGYDLMLKIQPYWPAKHSQIYPLLANLEKEEYVRYEHVAQSDKPDKKVYSLTEKGTLALKEWLTEPASDPVTRDELMLKAYCLPLVEPEIARKLFIGRLEHYQNKMRSFEDKIGQLQDRGELKVSEIPACSSPLFGPYILLHKAISNCRSNIEWCEWVLRLLP